MQSFRTQSSCRGGGGEGSGYGSGSGSGSGSGCDSQHKRTRKGASEKEGGGHELPTRVCPLSSVSTRVRPRGSLHRGKTCAPGVACSRSGGRGSGRQQTHMRRRPVSRGRRIRGLSRRSEAKSIGGQTGEQASSAALHSAQTTQRSKFSRADLHSYCDASAPSRSVSAAICVSGSEDGVVRTPPSTALPFPTQWRQPRTNQPLATTPSSRQGYSAVCLGLNESECGFDE